MSFAADGGVPAGPLLAEDARALTRLLRRSLGRGFRLVVIEVATPRLRQRLAAWLRAEVEPLAGQVIALDVASLPGENLWSELGERLWSELGERLDQVGVERERMVLALHGFQEAARGQPDEKAGLYRQLNVQRDLFVRDLGGFWVLLIHPQGSRKLQDIAPDFCDFASLWIRAPGSGRTIDLPTLRVTRDAVGAVLGDHDEPQPDLLQEAHEAIAAAHYIEARDLLTRFELAAGSDSEDEGHALCLRARLELARGNLDAARRAGERALVWSTARGDRAKPETAEALHLLAGVLEAQGHYEQARAAIEHSLAIKQEIYGNQEHPSVAASLHELARIHAALGHTEEARSLLERALKIHQSPGAIAASLHELASVLRRQGDYDGARRALERSLEIETQALGTELHPTVATILHSLAQVLHARGDLDGARQHVERSLEIEAEVHGTELHPSVAASLTELAAILREQGDLDGARRTIERALEIDAQVFGTQTHPTIAATLHELAQVLREQGDLDGARRTLERALEIVLEVFGTELHPDVAAILQGLAVLLADRGELDEAAASFERALGIETHIQGPDHHVTCITEVGFAELLLDMGERARAEALLRHARPLLASSLGPANFWVQKADALLERRARTTPT